MRLRLFMVAAVLLAAVPRSSAQLPTADAFNPGAGGGDVWKLAIQPDGSILAGGYFTRLGGQACTNLARLNANGNPDAAFCALVSRMNSSVSCLAVQSDGKIPVGGDFTLLSGQACTNFGRLNADGSRDTAFNPGVMPEFLGVSDLAVQADGKLLLGGYFTTMGGLGRQYIGRLNTNGSVDTSFNPGAENGVFALAVQADGKILAGGDFIRLGGQPRGNLGRLNASGSVDALFTPVATNTTGGGSVSALVVQPDGKILIGGDFTLLAGQARTNFGRLNADGSPDTSFNPGISGLTDYVNCLALQADGKILAGGTFTTLAGQSRTHICRLNADGSLDPAFNPGASGSGSYVNCLALQADGKILVGGNFTTLGGQARTNIGRLNNPDAATQSLAFNGSSIIWLRGGTSPEVWRTTFDVSTNGTSWVSLGAGQRTTGGWQLTGLNYPTNAIIRARGFVCGANWFVETLFAPAMPLQFVNANRSPSISNGWFYARLLGTTGSNAVVECSSDLVVWTPWQTNTLPAGGRDLAAPLGTNGQQFYRARLVP